MSELEGPLSHIDEQGAARMVDVGHKPTTDRRAVARAIVKMSSETASLVTAGTSGEPGHPPKGDVLATARVAGIQGAKRTSELIPLTHPLPLVYVGIDFDVDGAAGTIAVVAEARTTAQTGVEMEAMTAVAVAALTIYDMVKGIERGVEITEVVLLEKTGGKRAWRRHDER